MADYAIPQLCLSGYAIPLPLVADYAIPTQIKPCLCNTIASHLVAELRPSFANQISSYQCCTRAKQFNAYANQYQSLLYRFFATLRLSAAETFISISALTNATPQLFFAYQMLGISCLHYSIPVPVVSLLCLCFTFRCHSVTVQRVALPFRYSSKSCLPALFTRSYLQIYSYLIIAVQTHCVACLS